MAEDKLSLQKKILYLVIVLFALATALNVVGHLSLFKNNPPIAVSPTIEPTPTPELVMTPISTPVIDPAPIPVPNIEISRWKTYKNIKNNFTFQYPGNWKLLTNFQGSESDNSVSLTSPETLKSITIDIPENPTSDIIINYYSSIETYNSATKTLDELIKKEGMIKVGEILIDKARGVEVIERGLWDSYGIFVERDNHLYEISFISSMNKTNVVPVEWRIISTFKFMNKQ